MLLQICDRILNRLVLAMTFNIDEEEILPIFPLGRPALDLAHAEFQPAKRFERRIQRTNSVLDAKHERGLVIFRRGTGGMRYHQKPSSVVWTVLH